MPVIDGLQLIRTVKKEQPHICSIAMTGYTEEYTYMDVIQAGASDFINKPFSIHELEAKVKRAIIERNIKERLNRQSITDSLTGLFNHRYFYDCLSKEVARADRQGQPLSLVMLDLDDFKLVNDRHGHRVGDEVLQQVGQAILASIRAGVDTAFRYGGDEFAVILVDSGLEVARNICDRVLNALDEQLHLSASVGFAVHEEGVPPEEFVDMVDQMLYEQKSANKRLRLKAGN
jgi:diguanylate cyclase (GGDEF)-like protein